MAPPIVEAAAGSAAAEFKKESAVARLLGSGLLHNSRIDMDACLNPSGSAGIAELAVFHPVFLESKASITTTLTFSRWTQ